jgi:kynurenine formamidase
MALPEEFHDLARTVRNWGRWGPGDELGTLNLITPEVRQRAAGCVRSGRAFSLALPLSDREGIQTGAIPGRINPLRTMVAVNTAYTGDPSEFCTSDDVVVMGLQAGTHWDALAHVSYDGRLYNDHLASGITEHGASRCGIGAVRTLVSRGVLLAVARTKGMERLEPGYAITAEDLDAAAEAAQVEVLPGDVVLVRTGHMTLLREQGRAAYGGHAPGLSTLTVRWFRDHDVAAVATDNLTFEVFPCERPDVLFPVHLLHLVDMGMTQGQNWDLEALAQDCVEDGVHEFLLDASPLPFTGAVGAPVNPVAMK